jgi:DNA-binding response OmpR family regulator
VASFLGSILIVEDDEALRRMLEHALIFEGYRVLTAAHGAEALRILNIETPTLIVLDLVLPWVNGFEVLSTIREIPRLRRVPVLVVTATPTAPADVQLYGNVRLLHKPVNIDFLTPTIRQLLSVEAT